MKQLVHNKKTGELTVAEVPPPALRSGGVLVRNQYSPIVKCRRRHLGDGKLASLLVMHELLHVRPLPSPCSSSNWLRVKSGG